MTIDHILCATDGSDPSRRAVAFAAELAKAMGSRLTLISVRHFFLGRASVGHLQTPEEIDSILHQALDLARSSGCQDVEAVHLTGRDAAVLMADYADDHDVKLMVMGSTGKNALERFALGSTSADFLRKSRCPVTIVH